jgi:predicted DNA-binding ribbon-helix-helix protein
MDSGGRVMVRKRSVVLGTLKTSVSLEDAFWERLKLVAAENRVHVRTYIASIAATGEHDNLSSALRLAVLEHFVAKAEFQDRKRGPDCPLPMDGRSPQSTRIQNY